MPKVWIPKLAGHSYKSAQKYGDLTILLEEDISPFNVDRISAVLKDALQTADPGDYYIPVGPPIINMLVMKHWPFPVLNALMFHARTKEYIYREVLT